MALKEKLQENKKQNEEIQFAIADSQSKMSYQLGESDTKVKPIDYASMYDPFVKQYAEIQLDLDNGSNENPSQARKYADSIMGSVESIKLALENVLSNTEVWGEVTQLAGLMKGIDIMGTPVSRYMGMTVLAGDLGGTVDINAVDGDINKLAWEIYDENGMFIERMFLNKLNTLSETQDLFITIPDTSKQNQEFKKASDDIFEKKQQGSDPKNQVLTGGVTETYREIKADGTPDTYQKPLQGALVQDFVKISKEAISNSIQFNTEMDKITAGMIEAYESSDQVIAFNNNILSEVTDFYLEPAKALRPNQEKKFQEDYKKWYLEKEVPNEMPVGEPYSKKAKEETKEEVEEVDEFAEFVEK